MGNDCSSIITIDLDRTNSFYFTDESVYGSVGLNIIEGRLEANEIYITLTGKIGYEITQDNLNVESETSSHIETCQVPFYSSKVIFAHSELEQKELIYNQGQYSWPFHFPLTAHLPPTINRSQSYPYVRYYLQVVIDKPFCLLQHPQYSLPVTFRNENRKCIKLNGTLNKSEFVPGELFIVTLEIENLQRVFIQRIDLSMLQSYQIGRNSREFSILETTLPKIVNRKDEQIKETFSIIIPAASLPPSYRFQEGLQAAANVNVHYLLQFAVKVEGMFTNFEIKVPIIIGTESVANRSQLQAFNPLINPYSSNDEPLPSYDSIMQDMK